MSQYLYLPGIYYLFFYFVIYAFMGWCLETVYATLKKGKFVNRGFLNGPFCPIYGFGVLTLIIFLYPLRNNTVILFLGSVILTSILEYITGFLLEKFFHATWWDYSENKFNIKGRVCLRFSIYWGIFSVIVLKIIHPYVNNLVLLIPEKLGVILSFILISYFIADIVITVTSIIQLNALLKQLHEISDEIKSKVEILKENTIERTEVIEARIHELKGRYEKLISKRHVVHRRILSAFPGLKSRRFDSTLKEFREKLYNKLNN
ncbi:hypothetical protein Q428_12170 [Fervidicella metallireducens AeB]|uniref:ABC transporter permease n=1 Tax=Fervidicella metallireducens AeB TaxID=1403537 RepID=A0A017RT90_9CLOT|nr:putative ABC transporter permease [Fervidicella metallireducens]EYE87664.1 hypothetical protein Q428_12170 [Fervidicella metallireducens AeB]